MDNVLPDILDYDLVVLFIGINPSPLAAATGHRFPGPTNRFWRTLHLAGFTAGLLPAEQDQSLPQYGCGLVSAVARPTRRAGELSRAELVSAGDILRTKVEKYAPKWIAFLGKGAYAAIMARRQVTWGLQGKSFGGTSVWVLPDPSGLNRYTLPQLVEAYRALRVVAAEDFKAFGSSARTCPKP